MDIVKLFQSVKHLETKEEIVKWLYNNLTVTDAYYTIAELVLNYPQEEEKQDNRLTINEVVFNQIVTTINNAFKVVEMDGRGRTSDYVKLGYIGAMKKVLHSRAGATNSLTNLKLRNLFERELKKREMNGEDTTNFKCTYVDRKGKVINLPQELVDEAKEEMKNSPFEIFE